MKHLIHLFAVLVWAGLALAEEPKEVVLAELDLEPFGQPFIVRAVKREIEFRGPIALDPTTADAPDMVRRGAIFELHRLSKETGELRNLGGIPFVGERLGQFNRKAQLESDGARVWMCLTDAPQDMCLIFEMPVNGPTNPVDSFYSEAEQIKQHKAGTHTRLSIDILAPPGRYPSYRGIGNAQMKLIDGKLTFSGIATMGGVLDFKYDIVTKEWSGATVEAARLAQKAQTQEQAVQSRESQVSQSAQAGPYPSLTVQSAESEKAPQGKPTPPMPNENPASSIPWGIIVVLAAVLGCGLLWLLLIPDVPP